MSIVEDVGVGDEEWWEETNGVGSKQSSAVRKEIRIFGKRG